MSLFLDSNVLVDLMRGEPDVRRAYVGVRRAMTPLAVSVFVLQEVRFGCELSGAPAVQHELVDEWLGSMEVVPYEISDATAAARLQAQMRRTGRTAPYDDFLIGAHAAARGLALVTANARDFENIPGLKLLDWRAPPEQPQDPSHG